MFGLIILGALTILPIVLITVLRASAAICFLSVCLGSVLATYTASDATSFIGGFSPSVSVLTVTQWIQLILLIVPFVLTLVFTRKSVAGSKQLFNILTAVSAGLLFGLLAIPFLASSLQDQIQSQALYRQLSDLQTLVIFVGAILSLMYVLSSHRSLRKAEGKHSKHKG